MAVGFVSETSHGVTSSASTSGAVSFSASAGDTVLVSFATSVSISGVSCVDNNSNTLTAGTSTTFGPNVYTFYYTVPAGGATSFTVNWTTNATGWVNIVQYSGVGSINTSFSTGGSTTGTVISYTGSTTKANGWLIVVFGDTSTTSWSSPTGNNRVSDTGSPSVGRSCIMDNTSAAAGSLTCQITKSLSATWASIAYEFDPVVASSNANLLAMLGCGT